MRLCLWAGAVALGLVAEWVSGGFDDAARGTADLVTGWTLLACGLVAAARVPGSRTGPLLALTGAAWFGGNFAGVLVAVHRGPLVHALLSAPDGRLGSGRERAAVAIAYAVALVPAVWDSDVMAVALSGALVTLAAERHRHAFGSARRAAALSLGATAAVAAVIGLGAIARLASPDGAADDPALLCYEIVLVAVAVALAIAVVTRTWERSGLTDLVVELGEARSGALRDALAGALGDPSVEVGYWVPGRRVYVDADSRRLTLPAPGANRSTTLVERDGQPLAALVHDPAVLDDESLTLAVAAVTRMAASNARLRSTVQEQVDELEASSRRLLSAGDDERRRLEERLHEGAQRRLGELARTLRHARADAGPASRARVERAQELLDRTREDLEALSRGLHPRTLTEHGLRGALTSLAIASPVPVELAVDGGRAPAEVEAIAYFVCAEALANVAKYAGAGHVSVAVTGEEARLRVTVDDDGAGGADPAGSGLRGLADRLEAFGGRLVIDSPRGSGTHLAAEIPIDRGAT